MGSNDNLGQGQESGHGSSGYMNQGIQTEHDPYNFNGEAKNMTDKYKKDNVPYAEFAKMQSPLKKLLERLLKYQDKVRRPNMGGY